MRRVLFDNGKYAQARDAVVPVIESLEEAGWAAPAAELQCLLLECCRALKDIGGFVDASIGICRPWSVAPQTHKVPRIRRDAKSRGIYWTRCC